MTKVRSVPWRAALWTIATIGAVWMLSSRDTDTTKTADQTLDPLAIPAPAPGR